MLNFTVGPVQSDHTTLQLGMEQIPYFRTEEFSNMMLENELLLKKCVNADVKSRAVFLTGSGTSAMEAAIMNCLSAKDHALIINGGTFGQRFVELCKIHDISFDEIKIEYGMPLTRELLFQYDPQHYTSLLVNLHETSTGVLYHGDLIREFCKQNQLFLIIDAIGSFLADELDMQELDADVIIASSQKALACPPGIAMLILSSDALERIEIGYQSSMYFNLKSALENGLRGQTPFTPAVGILRQIHSRLKAIHEAGGAKSEIKRTHDLAEDFRVKISGLPLDNFSHSVSNALTALRPTNVSAYSIFMALKDDYNIWVCPNGGALADKVFRVGHLGALTTDENSQLIDALHDLRRRHLL